MKAIFKTSKTAATYLMAVLSMGLLAVTSCSEEVVDDYEALVRLSTPANAAAVTDATTENELKFSWDKVDGAYNYTAQIRLNEFGDIVSEIITTEQAAMFGELEHSTTYYFRVRSVDEFNEAKNSDWSEWVESATLVVDPQFAPLSTPADLYCDSAVSTASSLKFSWEVVENAVSYTYRYSAEGVEEVFADTEELSVELTGLQQGVEYTFSVKANPAADSETYRSSSYCSAVVASTVAVLATPEDLQNTLRMAEAATFEWSAVEGAAGYAFELYEKDMSTPIMKSSTLSGAATADGVSVETTNTSATFIGLAKDTYYSFRVMALAVEGDASVVNSSYTDYCVAKTLLTDATHLSVPSLSTASLNQVSFTAQWAAVASAASYKYQFGTSIAEAEASEAVVIAADEETGEIPTSLSKSSLNPETTYYLRVMSCPAEDDATKSDSEWSAWYEVSTPALAAALTVSTADELEAAFDCIAVGGVITVEAGNYIFDSTITLDKALTLQGADATARPVINFKAFALKPSEVCEAIVIKDIEFTSYKVDENGNLEADSYLGSYFIDNSGQGAMVNNLTVDNCLVYGGFKSAFLRINRVSGCGVENLTITNNVVSVGGNDGNIVTGKGKEFAASNWVIKNNTFDNIGAAYGATKKAELISLPTSTSASFILDMSNNTLYNMVVLDGKKVIYMGGTCDVTFSKNIVTIPVENEWSSGLCSNTITTCSDNFFFSSLAEIEGVTNVDPQISAYEFLKNYTPTNPDVVAAGAGDPRWLK